MKRLILAGVAALVAFSALTASAEPLDRFPWDWGTECPFPWSSVEGVYELRSYEGVQSQDGKYLHLSLAGKLSSGERMLRLELLTVRGSLEATGIAMANGDSKVLTAAMQTLKSDIIDGQVTIRAYVADTTYATVADGNTCTKQSTILAVTTCLAKRDCKAENYILKRQ